MAVARGGYVGLTRMEDDRPLVGAALDAAFVRECRGLGNATAAIWAHAGFAQVDAIAAATWRGTPELSRRRACVAAERIFVVGDAAKYVEPFTGEGMAWALESARAVAPLAARAAVEWRPELARLWSAEHARLHLRRRGVCWLITRALRWPKITNFAVAALSRKPVLAAPVIRGLNAAPA
jgi:flavin-dependent dehydrogenase